MTETNAKNKEKFYKCCKGSDEYSKVMLMTKIM